MGGTEIELPAFGARLGIVMPRGAVRDIAVTMVRRLEEAQDQDQTAMMYARASLTWRSVKQRKRWRVWSNVSSANSSRASS